MMELSKEEIETIISWCECVENEFEITPDEWDLKEKLLEELKK